MKPAGAPSDLPTHKIQPILISPQHLPLTRLCCPHRRHIAHTQVHTSARNAGHMIDCHTHGIHRRTSRQVESPSPSQRNAVVKIRIIAASAVGTDNNSKEVLARSKRVPFGTCIEQKNRCTTRPTHGAHATTEYKNVPCPPVAAGGSFAENSGNRAHTPEDILLQTLQQETSRLRWSQ